jgi:hypothetical protein
MDVLWIFNYLLSRPGLFLSSQLFSLHGKLEFLSFALPDALSSHSLPCKIMEGVVIRRARDPAHSTGSRVPHRDLGSSTSGMKTFPGKKKAVYVHSSAQCAAGTIPIRISFAISFPFPYRSSAEINNGPGLYGEIWNHFFFCIIDLMPMLVWWDPMVYFSVQPTEAHQLLKKAEVGE